MSTYTFCSDLNDAVTFAREQNAQHGHVAAIKPYLYGKGTTNPMAGYRVEMFRGMIVTERERNMHDDSDFFATWYDAETDTFGEFCYGSTRGWTYANGSVIDASDELRAAWDANRDRARAAGNKWRAEKEAAAQAKAPVLGAVVRVKSKRSKVAHGTEGVVVWFGKSSYARPNYYANPYAGMLTTKTEKLVEDLRDYRVGIRDINGDRHFLAATAVEVLTQAPAESF